VTRALPRRTLARPVTLAGPALFSGIDASQTILPADAPTGLTVRASGRTTPATVDHLSNRPAQPIFASLKPRCTSIRTTPDDASALATVEHALSALAGLGVTDAILETDAAELPILDGSALFFVQAILEAGLRTLPGTIEPITLTRRVEVIDGDATLIAEPADNTDLSYTVDYGSASLVPAATARWNGSTRDYETDIAPSRTFSTLSEANQMKALGLFARFTTHDLLVIGPEGPVDNAWRFPDECARHKLLDLIGDLALLGRPLIAKVTAHKTGHAHTHELCRRILASI
jgi:UDP-3-O-acyl N-acetylglucosamine deacetylase